MKPYRPPYRARRNTPGTHVRLFWLLTRAEQQAKVRSLIGAGMSRGAVAQLTGLTLPEIAQFVESAP